MLYWAAPWRFSSLVKSPRHLWIRTQQMPLGAVQVQFYDLLVKQLESFNTEAFKCQMTSLYLYEKHKKDHNTFTPNTVFHQVLLDCYSLHYLKNIHSILLFV